MTESGLTQFGAAAPDTLRLFFALWPDDATRDALDRAGKRLHQHWGGRRMRAETLHITLAFLGSTPAEQLDGLTACVDTVRTDAFELVLAQAGYWRHNRIGWLGASQMPPPYIELVGTLNAALRGAGFAVDARPHVPHVTLLRNSAGGEVPECTPVHWPISDFVLVASRREADGMHYDVIRRWPLARSGAAR
ncbi:MAG TPA: RNA 2',3'-cyclic phosphodiesterase [Thiobacillus sp.]|nr:RNA 2',3'-cyclic phosphodiesterase [Thiobacillus sp.]